MCAMCAFTLRYIYPKEYNIHLTRYTTDHSAFVYISFIHFFFTAYYENLLVDI